VVHETDNEVYELMDCLGRFLKSIGDIYPYINSKCLKKLTKSFDRIRKGARQPEPKLEAMKTSEEQV
jgi:hypothetical protein